MSDRIPITPFAGGFSSLEGTDVQTAVFGSDQRITQFLPSVITPPGSAPCVIELRDSGGVQTISATIPVGEQTPAAPASGIIDLTAGDALFYRVIESGGARDLGGWYEAETTSAAPSVTVQLTTLADVKQYLGLSDTSNDSFLTVLINRTSRAIQEYVDYAIIETDIAGERHDGGWPRVVPRIWPVTDITQVQSYGDPLDAANTRISSDRFFIESISGELLTIFPKGRQNIEIDYTAGHAVVPDDIVHAATLQTIREFNRTQPSRVNNVGISEVTEASGGQTIFQTGFLLPEVERMLAPYKRIF